MDEQDSARLNYENLVKRINKLLDDYIMLIDTITGLREKMYTLIAQMCQNPNQNNQVPNEKNDQEKEKIKSMTNQPLRQFSASSSYHVDYQYLQTNFDIHNEKIDQQFIKDIAKDFWKLYLKFSLLDGNRVQHMFIKAKALGYNTDEVIEKRDILRKYFSDQNQLDEAQKLAQAQNANLILNNAANNNNNSTNNNLNNSASYNNNNNNNNHNTSISQSSHSSIQQI